MAYHGYIHFICQYAAALNKLRITSESMLVRASSRVKILEIGIDKGVTFFSLLNNLNVLNIPFEYHGVDVKVQEHLKIMIGAHDPQATLYTKNHSTSALNEMNSLDYLANCQLLGNKFDIILVDGDHNYPTVSKECKLISSIIKDINTLIIFDDYSGKWSDKDLFYKDKSGYKENHLLTDIARDPIKRGVKIAVNEFLHENPERSAFTINGYGTGEPVCVVNKNNMLISSFGQLTFPQETKDKQEAAQL